MSKESQILMRTFHAKIEKNTENLIECLSTSEASFFPGDLSDQDVAILKTISLTNEQLIVLRKLVQATGRLIVFGILSLIDGVSYVDDGIPDLALVNRNTREDIADQFLHDEFIDQRPE